MELQVDKLASNLWMILRDGKVTGQCFNRHFQGTKSIKSIEQLKTCHIDE